MTTDDDRIGYLAGEPADGLDEVERQDLDDLRSLLADRAVWAEADAGLEDRIVAAVVAEAGRPHEAAPPAPERRRRRFVLPALAGAAAAAVVIVALAVSAGRTGDSPQLAASLRPTELSPGAEGHATLTRTDSGWRVELDAQGLPRLDGGRFYQAWLRSADGELVAIGTFNEPNDVVLWAGVSPTEYRTLTVTEEEAGCDPGSSGRRVLEGVVTST